MTAVLCWGFIALVYLFGAEQHRPGDSGYPEIEIAAMVLLLAPPLWVHGLIHTTRRYLDRADSLGRGGRPWLAAFLPGVTGGATLLSLMLAALCVSMLDAESIVPRNLIGNLSGLLQWMVSAWTARKESMSFELIALPLGYSALACALYVFSYGCWRLFYALAPTRRMAMLPRAAIVIGGINVFWSLLIGLVYGYAFGMK